MKRFNYIQFFAVLALITVGTISIWSAGNARSEAVFHDMWISNLVTAAVGLVLYFLLARTDYRKLLDIAAWPLYGAALIMLIAVLVFGTDRFGGRRWLWFFQPSEISKLCILLLVAALAARERFRSFTGFLALSGLVGLPCLLILAEPDLGTALTLVPAVFLMLFVGRVWRKGLIVIVTVGAIAALAVLGAVYEAERPGVSAQRREAILEHLPLRPHQVKRVKTFLFPETDQAGSGYNIRQAKISIGSGGMTGKGFGKGETNHLKYLPQAISMNDFIFCVYAEETGYVGSLVLLALFAALLLPGCWIAYRAPDDRGRLLALGISMLLFAHVYINIAMSIGLVPITGLPLPFISSGRTFLITSLASLGLVQSIALHERNDD